MSEMLKILQFGFILRHFEVRKQSRELRLILTFHTLAYYTL